MDHNISSRDFLVGKHKSTDSSNKHHNKKTKLQLQPSVNVSDSYSNSISATLIPITSCNDSNGTCTNVPNINTNISSSSYTTVAHQCQFCNSVFANDISLKSHDCSALPNGESFNSVNSRFTPQYNTPIPNLDSQTKNNDTVNQELKNKYQQILIQASVNDSNIDIKNIPQVQVLSTVTALKTKLASVFQCPVCFQYFEDYINFTIHVAEDHSQYYENLLHNKNKLSTDAVEREIYYCKKCKKIFSSHQVSHTHYTFVADYEIQCLICDIKYDKKVAKEVHEKKCHGRNIKNLYFEDLQLLQSSGNTASTVIKMSVTRIIIEVFLCSCCTQSFYTIHSIFKHLIQDHSDLRYAVIKKYIKHQYIEHFVCNLCPQNSNDGVFKKASECLLHCQAKHINSVVNDDTSASSSLVTSVCDNSAITENEISMSSTMPPEDMSLAVDNLIQSIKVENVDPEESTETNVYSESAIVGNESSLSSTKPPEETPLASEVVGDLIQSIKVENVDPEESTEINVPEAFLIKKEIVNDEDDLMDMCSNTNNTREDGNCENLDVPEMKIEIEENQLQDYYEESQESVKRTLPEFIDMQNDQPNSFIIAKSNVPQNKPKVLQNNPTIPQNIPRVPQNKPRVSQNKSKDPQNRHKVPQNINIHPNTPLISSSNKNNGNVQQGYTFKSENTCVLIKAMFRGITIIAGKKVTKRVFMCLKCKAHFFDISDLEKHTKLVHPEVNLKGNNELAVAEIMSRWLCELCRPSFKIFTLQLLYLSHLKSEHAILESDIEFGNIKTSLDKNSQLCIDATFKFVESSDPAESSVNQSSPQVLNVNTPQIIYPNNLESNQNSVSRNIILDQNLLMNSVPQVASQNNLILPQSVVDTNNVLNQNQLVMTSNGLVLVPRNHFHEHVNLISNPVITRPQFSAPQINPSFPINPIYTQANLQPSVILPPVQSTPFPTSQIFLPPSSQSIVHSNSEPYPPQVNLNNHLVLLQKYLNPNSRGSNLYNSKTKQNEVNILKRNSPHTPHSNYSQNQDNSVAILTKHGLQRIDFQSDHPITPVIVSDVSKSRTYRKPGTSLLKSAVRRKKTSSVASSSNCVIQVSSDEDSSDISIVNEFQKPPYVTSETAEVIDESVCSSTKTTTSIKEIDPNGPDFAELAIKQNMMFECCYCKKILFSEKQFIHHKDQCQDEIVKVMVYKIEIEKHTCSHCSLQFNNQDDCKSHINLEHENCEYLETIKQIEMYRCPNCLKICVSPSKLVYHMKICKYSIINAKNVIKFVIDEHYTCSICKAWFDNPEKLDHHIKSTHSNISKDTFRYKERGIYLWSCTICPMQSKTCFNNLDLCKKHLIDVHEVFLTTEEVEFIRESIPNDKRFTTYPGNNNTLESELESVAHQNKSDVNILKCYKLSQRPVVVLERLKKSDIC